MSASEICPLPSPPHPFFCVNWPTFPRTSLLWRFRRRRPGAALKFAHDDLRADEELCLAAVEGFPLGALPLCARAARADRAVVAAAVARNGFALQAASRGLRGDRGVVLSAVAQVSAASRGAGASCLPPRGPAVSESTSMLWPRTPLLQKKK